jgi:hypothetical protein
MLARFKHCLLVSRVESPHIACSLSGDLRSVTVPRVASHTSVRDRRELTKLSPAIAERSAHRDKHSQLQAND